MAAGARVDHGGELMGGKWMPTLGAGRHGALRRATALALSWVFTANTIWAAAPPPVRPQRAATPPVLAKPLPGLPGFPGEPSVPPPPALRLPVASALAALAPGLDDKGERGDRDKDKDKDHREEGEKECESSHDDHHRDGDREHEDDRDRRKPASGTPAGASFFGPQKYLRTSGPKNLYTTRVTVPASVAAPFTMHVQNGELDGTHRVSSAWIKVNGVCVARPNDFGEKVSVLDRSVSLTPQTTLTVMLASKPGSYLYLSLAGQGADKTAPKVTVVAPAPGSSVNTDKPHLGVQYVDEAGAGEPGASGVDTATLKVLLDDVDRTSLFTARSGDASLDLPASLALTEGAHTLQASIKDRAGNTGSATASFMVDLAPPAIQVREPAAGAYLGTATPAIEVQYQDNQAVDLGSLQVFVNGADRTSLFSKTPSGATATLPPGDALPNGSNQVTARIKDLAGTLATSSVAFNVDTQPPALTIGQPVQGSRHGTSEVEVIVQYADDQALDLSSLVVTVDGTAVSLGQGPQGAMGNVGPLLDGGHSVWASILDRAGNRTEASVSFIVDTQAPAIQVLQPPPGFLIATNTPQVLVTYSDSEVDLGSLKLTINGADATSRFAVGAGTATATAPTLPEGTNTIAAEIKDLTGNQGQASSTFTVDTVAPTGSLAQPAGPVNVPQPSILVRYQDAVSGIDTASVKVFLDEAEVTPAFAVASDSVVGTPTTPLAEGAHHVKVEVADRAGNVGTIDGSFVVDTIAPTASFEAPADNAFLNSATPALKVVYADGTGTGVDPSGIRVYLSAGADPTEQDVTADFEVGAREAMGAIPETSPLLDGTYHLRVQVPDHAGNAGDALASFEVDTVAPTGTLESPGDGAYVNTATPVFTIRYQDPPQSGASERSGIDLGKLVLKVDGVDLTARLTREPGVASGALLPEDALSQGAHQVEVSVLDRAGNAASIPPQGFTVDTIPPAASVEQPLNLAWLKTPSPQFRFLYGDGGGTGIEPGSVKVQIDGIDQTAAFTLAADRTEGTLSLPDGLHTARVEVEDLAGNAASATASFYVDTHPPVVAQLSLPDGAYVSQVDPANGTVQLSGSVQDLDPGVSVQCQSGSTTVQATVSGGQFTCSVPLSEGANSIQVTASDHASQQSQVSENVYLDTTPPVVSIAQPAAGDVTSAQQVTVMGGVEDASPVSVSVEGIAATVSGGTFTVASVPVGDGPQAVLHAVALDAAGNQATASVTIGVDRTPPVVHIASPAASSYLRGPSLTVTGTAQDASPVMVDVNGTLAAVTGSSFTATLPALDGALTLRATAHDAAGNESSDHVSVTVDSTPPVIQISSPAEGTLTRATSIAVTGTVEDLSPVTLRYGSTPVGVSGGSFALQAPLGAEGATAITLVATDAAGNQSSTSLHVVVDRTPPSLAIAAPTPGGVIGSLPALVQGTVQDASPVSVTVDGIPASLVGQAWQASIASLAEGPHTFAVVAADAAGNQTAAAVDATIDLGPPTIAITSPASGSLTRLATATVTGTAAARSSVSVAVNGIAASLSGTVFTATVPLAEGDNALRAVATSATGRTAEASITVTRDSTPPVVSVAAPDTLSKDHPAQAVATATDNVGVAQVVISVNGASVGSFPAPPYQVALTVPEGAKNGDTLIVTAVATDRAGNTASSSRGVRVVSQGAITGLVLQDTTGLPLAGASVRMASGPMSATATDETGRYALPASDALALLVASKDGMTSVERQVSLATGVGTVPVDARLTPLAAEQSIGPAGDTLAAGPVTVSVPQGVLSSDAAFTLTLLSAQGLPGLLPLGWSPVAALDLRADGVSSPVNATFTGIPQGTLYLASYSLSLHGWTLLAAGLQAADGALTVTLPGPGRFAVIAPDAADVLVSAQGALFTGVEMAPLPDTATGPVSVNPATLPPSGGTSIATLTLKSPTALPSGTVVQAVVTESFTLTSGEKGSEEQRLEDVVLFKTPAPEGATLAATFPIVPSRTFEGTDLKEGTVHVEILAGRESVRGTVGGNEAVDLVAGDAHLSVAAGALPTDLALSLEVPQALSSFLPATGPLTPVSEVVVDFSGQTLGIGAELSVDGSAVPVDSTLLIARVERLDGIPRLQVVALGALVNDRVVSLSYPGLPGINEGGRYVVYRSATPVGFVGGVVTSQAGPARAVVESAGLPFIAIANPQGAYVLPVLPGANVPLTAKVPKTSLVGSASAGTVVAAETTPLNISLSGSVVTATVIPADGSVAVATNTQVEITTPVALNPATVTTDTVKLLKADGTAVTVRLVLSGSAKVLALVPTEALAFETTYTLQASGLADAFGGAVAVPAASFTTKANVPPVYNTGALTFSMPDAQGLVTVSAPPQTFPPGTTILIIDSGNGVVLSLTAGNQGEVAPMQMPATINDQMMVTITDPLGNVTTFNRSQFVDAATGKTAIGPGGGVVVAADGSGVELRIPEGALDKGVTLKIEGVTAEQLDALFPGQKPDLPGATLGSGLKITSEDKPTFKKEVKLAFPLPQGLPAKADDAFFYVYRRIEGPKDADGKPTALYETVDQAFIENGADGKPAKVVTASYPFSGYLDSYGAFGISPVGAFALQPAIAAYSYLMWSYNQLLPGAPLPGVITGKVLRTKWEPNAPAPTYEVIKDKVTVRVEQASGGAILTVAQAQAADGTFTLWDPSYTGGPITIKAVLPGGNLEQPCAEASELVRCASAYEGNPQDWKSTGLRFYRNIAQANVTFPPVKPLPPAPDLRIDVMVRNADGTRTPTTGFVVVGTPLVIGTKVRADSQQTLTIQTIQIQGKSYGRQGPLTNDPSGFTYVVDPEFTPAQVGSYTVQATGLPAFGAPISASYSFAAIAGGGSNTTPVDGPPTVVTASVAPKKGATGVPVTVFPQLVFSEPVTNVSTATVTLNELNKDDTVGDAVAITLSGVGQDGLPRVPVSSTDVVTSLTIQPLVGLKYNQRYQLALSSKINDIDRDATGTLTPRALVPFSSDFTTFGPQGLPTTVVNPDGTPGTNSVASPGIVVLGSRAYLVQNAFMNGTLHAYDTTDPVSLQELQVDSAASLTLPVWNFITNRPVDIAGEDPSMLVVATTSTNSSKPSNIWVFDVSQEASVGGGTLWRPQWKGIASVSSGAMDGFLTRIAVKGGYAYTITSRKGLQVVDLNQAMATMEQTLPWNSGEWWNMFRGISTDGAGYGQGAVTATIPVKKADRDWFLNDIKVGLYSVNGESQPLMVVAGEPALVVANPQTQAVLVNRDGLIDGPGGQITWSSVVALGNIGGKDIALLAGYGKLKDPQTGALTAGTGYVLAVLDMTEPVDPKPLAFLPLDGPPQDILIKDSDALVGLATTVQIVNLADPSRPVLAGTIEGVGGRLALGENGILLSTAYSVFGGASAMSGVHTAALGSMSYFRRISPGPFGLVDGKNPVPVVMDVGIVPVDYEVDKAQVDLYQEGTVVATLPVTFNSLGRAVLAAGFAFNPGLRYEAQARINPGQGVKELVSNRKALRPSRVEFAETRQVEVQDQGTTKLVRVAKVYDARPYVQLNAPAVESWGVVAYVTLSGTVRDELAPVTTLLIDNETAEVTQTSAGPEGLGPFEGTFSKRVMVERNDQLLTATAVNALGNVGWDSVWLLSNPGPDGAPLSRGVKLMESVPRSTGDAREHRFRLEVQDRGFAGAMSVDVELRTDLEQKTVRLERQGEVFQSKPLYLVPEGFTVPTGLSAELTRKLSETRIRARLGTKPAALYASDSIEAIARGEAVAAGLELVDANGQRMRFVPGGLARPRVAITDFDVSTDTRDVLVRGTVSDPVTEAVAGAPKPKVTANGIACDVTGSGGAYTFVSQQRVPLPLPLTHVQARAENVTGAFGVAGRVVTLKDGEPPQVEVDDNTPPVLALPDSTVRPFKVKVYGPPLAPSSITGTVSGVRSKEFSPALPEVALQFEQSSSSGGVSVYLSKDRVLGAKLPGHDWLNDRDQPYTPPDFASAPLVALEVGGFVDTRLSLGTAGPLDGLVDVSGFEVLAPREGSIINMEGAASTSLMEFLHTTYVHNWKWRGIAGPPSVRLELPGLGDDNDQAREALLSSQVPTTLRRDSISVALALPGGLEENVYKVAAIDEAANRFEVESGLFGFTEDMSWNPTPIADRISDPASLQLGVGLYFLPAVADAMDLVYPPGIGSDVQISRHLRWNGLRPIAIKRNGGTVVTVARRDGRSQFEPLVWDVPSGAGLPEGWTEPRADQLIDGQDLYYRDILSLGMREAWVDTYTSAPNYPYVGVWQRSALIQSARRKLDLPECENGRSQEYQAQYDAAKQELAWEAFWLLLPAFFRGLQFARGMLVAWADATIYEVTEVAPGFVTLAEVEASNVIRPRLLSLGDHALDAGSPRVAELVLGYRRLQMARRGAWLEQVTRDVIETQMGNVSAELGIHAAQQVASYFIPNMQGAVRICCDGALSGGGANDKFDEVWRRTDRSIVAIEAKGRRHHSDIRSILGGRKVTGATGEVKYALQGTREYMEETARLMTNPNNDAKVIAAGQEVLDALAAGKAEYYITRAAWAGKRMRKGITRGLVWGVSKVVGVWRAVL